MPFWIYINLCSNIYFFYLRWNLPKIASVVEFAFPTGVFFISFGKKSSPRELIVFLIRILWNQSTGPNSREMVSSAWSLLITCFQNFFVKALSKKTSWTWWSCLVWLQSSRHHLCLTRSILYHVNWGPHRKSFVKWSHHPLILVLCMSTSSMVLFRMVFSRALSQGRRLGQPGMNHHICKNSTRMELGLFWRETAYMIWSWFARKDSLKFYWEKERRPKQFQSLPHLQHLQTLQEAWNCSWRVA